jgi:quinolinate synthase
MVNRLRTKNTYILSSTKPECPTMNETTLEDVYRTLKSIKDDTISKENEIFVSDETAHWAKVALERMFEV